MEVWQKEALLRHRMAILDDLHVDYVLDHLIARQVLLEEHKESIFTQHGRRNRARHLLDILPSLGPTAYLEFIASLREPYHWLAEILSQESVKTATNVASTSQYSVSNSVQNQQQVPLNPGEINQLLISLASVANTCGKSLCAVGDTVTALVKSMKNTGSVQSSNAHISRQNSINLSKNEQQIVDASRQITMGGWRGGGDDSENEDVVLKTEKSEVPPSSLPLPENSFDVKGSMPSKIIDDDTEKIIEVATYEKIINCSHVDEDTIDGPFAKEVTREEDKSAIVHDHMVSKIDDVSYIGENEQFKTSRATNELHNDSPDSGISGDGDLGQIQEGIASLVIMHQNGIPAFDDDFENFKDVKMDLKSDQTDSLLMTPSGSSQWMADKDSNIVLNPVLNEMETLKQSLSDMTVALRAIVQISERAFNFQ